MCAGEFGRTPKINKNSGTRPLGAVDGVRAWPAAAFKRGYAHGTTDASGMAPATEPVRPDDMAGTIFHNLGVDAERRRLQTPTGRPVQLFREGKVIEKVLA